MSRKAAFIDRDGVLNEERAFVHRVEDLVLLPGAIEALRALQTAGYLLVVITNQSGIARGLYSEADYLHLTAHLRERLRAAGINLDAVEYCPHLPDAPVERYRLDCDCRKPKPGMLQRAIAALDIDPAASFLVGDRLSDVEAGRTAGVGRCFLVRTGYALPDEAVARADAVYDDLLACVSSLLSVRQVAE
ncbi:MAG: D-glycero-beta-D-manno-heptose 1,7-bisphosphate 7-phosphatase [Gammaproteobacteria bacterium]|nr:D-glycero-beta-D-manno-heptose 1,7-bisphosphate 7-phosphatase [Gammaproteobacteria bacterium]MDE2261052.1 D-glycero-beta-D-manno-heptose 1,7-bisphosphate 7-phosphatase [Gammaproteobacteria bacterium]